METASPIADRLKILVDYYKMSTRAFAIKCGITQASLDRQIKGLRGVSLDTITSIALTFPEISTDWLLLGKGDMMVGTQQDASLDKVMKLVDTIATLQDTINNQKETITALKERIKQLEK